MIHFFNALTTNAPSLNTRVFHQQELEQSGFTIEKVEQVSWKDYIYNPGNNVVCGFYCVSDLNVMLCIGSVFRNFLNLLKFVKMNPQEIPCAAQFSTQFSEYGSFQNLSWILLT